MKNNPDGREKQFLTIFFSSKIFWNESGTSDVNNDNVMFLKKSLQF